MKPILLEKKSDYPNSGYGYLTKAYNQKIHETSSGEYTYEFDLPASDKLFKYVKQDMWLYVASNIDTYDFFYIDNLKIKNNPDSLHAVCNQQTVLLKELYTDKVLTPDGGLFFVDTKKINSQELIKRLNDIINSVNDYDIKVSTDVNRDVVFPLMASGRLIDYLTDKQIGFMNVLGKVMMIRNGNNIFITENVGKHTIDIRRGKNIQGVSLEKNYTNIINSVQFFMYKKSIWDINYTPVYSKIYKYPNYDKFTRTRDLKIYTDQADMLFSSVDLNDMLDQYVAQHPNASEPKYSLEVNTIEYGQKLPQQCEIGDLARIYDPILDIQTTQPIYERTFDPDLNINTSFKAGTVEQSIFDFLDQRITSNDFANQTTSAKLKVTSDTLDKTNDDVSTATKNIDDLTSNLSTAQNDISRNRSDLSSAKNDISTARSDISSLKSKIADLERRI